MYQFVISDAKLLKMLFFTRLREAFVRHAGIRKRHIFELLPFEAGSAFEYGMQVLEVRETMVLKYPQACGFAVLKLGRSKTHNQT